MQLPRYYINRLGIPTDSLRDKSIEKDMHLVENIQAYQILLETNFTDMQASPKLLN